MIEVAVAFGSNVGDRLDHIRFGLQQLGEKIHISAVSKVYETAPMYVQDQDRFLNGVALGKTDLPPLGLLRILKGIEVEAGRRSGVQYGPRELDLDLIAYGSVQYRFQGQTKLEVPHPKVSERAFVLVPLAELNRSMHLPGLGHVDSLVEQLPANEGQILGAYADLSL